MHALLIQQDTLRSVLIRPSSEFILTFVLHKVTTQKPWKLASCSQRRLALATLCICGTRTSVITLQLASVPCMKSQSAVSSKTARTQCSRIFFSARCIINRRFIWKYGLFHLISKSCSLVLKIDLLNEYFTAFFFSFWRMERGLKTCHKELLMN